MDKERTNTLQEKLGQNGSPISKYRRLTVGNYGYAHLILFEIINFCCIPLRGKFGVFMRKLVLPFIIGKSGQKLSIGTNCTIRNGKKFTIGNEVVIEDDVTLDVKPGDKKLIIGNRVHIGRRTIFNCSGGVVEIGENTVIGSFCRLGSLQGLTIGHHCRLDDNSCISGASHSFSRTDIPIIRQNLTCKGPTFIGNCVTIGKRVTILDGVKIGNNVTILPDSLVNRDIAEGLMVTGVPARVVQQ